MVAWRIICQKLGNIQDVLLMEGSIRLRCTILQALQASGKFNEIRLYPSTGAGSLLWILCIRMRKCWVHDYLLVGWLNNYSPPLPEWWKSKCIYLAWGLHMLSLFLFSCSCVFVFLFLFFLLLLCLSLLGLFFFCQGLALCHPTPESQLEKGLYSQTWHLNAIY